MMRIIKTDLKYNVFFNDETCLDLTQLPDVPIIIQDNNHYCAYHLEDFPERLKSNGWDNALMTSENPLYSGFRAKRYYASDCGFYKSFITEILSDKCRIWDVNGNIVADSLTFGLDSLDFHSWGVIFKNNDLAEALGYEPVGGLKKAGLNLLVFRNTTTKTFYIWMKKLGKTTITSLNMKGLPIPHFMDGSVLLYLIGHRFVNNGIMIDIGDSLYKFSFFINQNGKIFYCGQCSHHIKSVLSVYRDFKKGISVYYKGEFHGTFFYIYYNKPSDTNWLLISDQQVEKPHWRGLIDKLEQINAFILVVS